MQTSIVRARLGMGENLLGFHHEIQFKVVSQLNGGKQYSVFRSYDQFKSFYDELKSAEKISNMPPFPESNALWSGDALNLEPESPFHQQRLKSLKQLLFSIFDGREIELECVKRFFQEDAHEMPADASWKEVEIELEGALQSKPAVPPMSAPVESVEPEGALASKSARLPTSTPVADFQKGAVLVANKGVVNTDTTDESVMVFANSAVPQTSAPVANFQKGGVLVVDTGEVIADATAESRAQSKSAVLPTSTSHARWVIAALLCALVCALCAGMLARLSVPETLGLTAEAPVAVMTANKKVNVVKAVARAVGRVLKK